jgi:hypothetical protein
MTLLRGEFPKSRRPVYGLTDDHFQMLLFLLSFTGTIFACLKFRYHFLLSLKKNLFSLFFVEEMTRSYTRIRAENMKKSKKEGVDCYKLLLLLSHFINYSCFGSHESSLCLLPLWSDSSRNRLFWEQPVKAIYYLSVYIS